MDEKMENSNSGEGNRIEHCGNLSSLPTGIQLRRIQVFWVVRLSGRVTDNRRFEKKRQPSKFNKFATLCNKPENLNLHL